MEINKFDNKFFTAGVKKQTPGLNKIAITPVDKALAFVIENFGEPLELDDLAGAAGISKFNLCRSFQRKLGITPMRWLWIFRTLLAGEFIKLVPSWSLTDIAFSCGFTSNAHFSRAFSAIYGLPPSEYRKQSAGTVPPADKVNIANQHNFDLLYNDNQQVVASAFQRMIAFLKETSKKNSPPVI